MARRRKKTVGSYRHSRSKRANLPTDQTERYMKPEDLAPVRYTPEVRKPDGAPRLSWERKEGLEDLATNAGPLFVHEKVSPTAFASQLQGETATTLFNDFNGLPPDAAWSCYTHRGNWSNRIIKGHSSDVMASLAAKEDLAGKVQMIYWDPPYGISFKASYQPNTKKRAGGKPAEPAMTTAFRDTYRNGIHSYLDAVYRTAVLGRALLKESGSFFMQISSANLHRCALVLDEVFGPENRVATIAFAKSGATSARMLPSVADYLVWYSRHREAAAERFQPLYEPLSPSEKIEYMSSYAMVELPNGSVRQLTPSERNEPTQGLPDGARLFRRARLTSQGVSETGRSEPFVWQGRSFPCDPGRHWAVSHEGLKNLDRKGRLISSGDRLDWKWYAEEMPGRRIHNLWAKTRAAKDLHYVVETAESVIERCILMATDPGDLVLDPTCGSGTTAFVAEKWGRRWITIDASAIPVALCRQRIVSGVHDWFLTQDDPEGARKEAQLSQTAPPPPDDNCHFDPASGFVYERVPYVSAAALAYDHPPKATLLVDRPLKKWGWKRLAAPFTVESHSPWRYEPVSGGSDESIIRQGIRERVLESLGTAGFRSGGDDGARWHLDDAENWPGQSRNLTHEGRVRETGERVALLVLSDDQSANRNLVDKAAEEAAARAAIKGLVVVAFHYEPDTSRGFEQRGRLGVVRLQANRDLAIAELKPGKEDHAFVLVGEPDIKVHTLDGGLKVEVRGWNSYDPMTGQVRSGKPGEIDCWLLDTNHDGRSFFARRIHFPGKKNDRQLKRFKAALGKRIRPELWASMQSLASAPFARPTTGRIAVRIITTTGDEMLAVRNTPA